MFKKLDRVDTPQGPGTIKDYKKSTYSKNILFYIVKLDSTGEDYLCPLESAKKL